jgi:beta-lactamase superfamily II metal-dependent hydrolase
MVAMAKSKRTGMRPSELTIRSYDVGFGDCYLLSFKYANESRHVLIDFGSTRKPVGKKVTGNFMERIAQQIATDCGNQLHAVVATHRHKDHISGFTMTGTSGPGATIRALKPKLVIQPWTEDPKAARDAKEPTKLKGLRQRSARHIAALRDMNHYAAYAQQAAKQLRGSHLKATRDQLEFLGDDNELANRDAVTNLMGMAPNRYVYYGMTSGLEALLPGVKVRVLGPPTVKQTETILKQRSTDKDEFWQLRSHFWAQRAALSHHPAASAEPLFPKHLQPGNPPWEARWYVYHAQIEHSESLLSIVRTLDDAMNNTSVILLFEAGGKKILFPGDAQYENWMYALGQPGVPELLADVNVYKVGHHGSLNATPRRLWNGFKKRGGAAKPDRLMSFLSTRDHVHGHADQRTEVPRQTLVDALQKDSVLMDTRSSGATNLSVSNTIDL